MVLPLGRGNPDRRNDEREIGLVRIGTVSLSRVGELVNVGLGDCLIADQSMGVCPDGSPYLGTLDSGGAAIDTSTLPNYAAEATAAGLGIPPPVLASSLPTSLPAITLPKGVVVSPTGLQTAVTCPPGYTAVGGVCSPIAAPASTTTLISGVPNWALYGGIGLMFLVMMSGGGRGRR